MKIAAAALAAIKAYGVEGYPEEVCGILVGSRARGFAAEAKPARNIVGEPGSPWPELGRERRRDRYYMDPRDQMRIEREADGAGQDIVGFYHTHPDHPAQPSATDASVAYAGYVYVIVSIAKGEPADVNGFAADKDEGPFHGERLEIV